MLKVASELCSNEKKRGRGKFNLWFLFVFCDYISCIFVHFAYWRNLEFSQQQRSPNSRDEYSVTKEVHYSALKCNTIH